MADINELMGSVFASASNVPDMIAEDALRHASRELCRESRVWREDLEPVSMEAAQTQTLTLPDGAALVEILTAVHSLTGERIMPTTPAALNVRRPGWRTETGVARNYYRNGTAELGFVPRAELASGGVQPTVELRVALMPTLQGNTVGDLVMLNYGEVILNGALGRLLAMPGRDWTDTAAAGYHKGMFANEIALLTSRATDEHAMGVARTVSYGGY